jgi:hypothetical protein
VFKRRSEWPGGLRHELSSPARTLRSWVQIPLKEWMAVLCAFILCIGRGLATGWSPVQGVLPTVYRITKVKKRPRPNKGLYSHNNNNNNNNNSIYFTCKLNNPEANYKASMSREEKKTHTKYKNKAILIILIPLTQRKVKSYIYIYKQYK